MAVYTQQCSQVGSFIYATNFTLYIELTETDIRIPENDSKTQYNVYCRSSGSGSLSANHRLYFKINGVTIRDETVYVNVASPNANIPIASGTTSAITHNSGGDKQITFEASITATGGYGLSASKSDVFTLTTIPRTSTASCTTANVEEPATIIITRASNSFTHTLTYAFGNLSGTIATKTSEISVPWTIPSSFYARISGRSAEGVLTCITYNGNTEIGSTTSSFTVTTSESRCKPELSTTAEDVNSTTIALTNDSSKIIKYASTVRVTITANAKNSATLVSKTVNGESVSGTTKDFTSVSTNVFKTIVTDSREYSTTDEKTLTMIPYVPLTLNTTVRRTQPTTGEVELEFSGNYYSGSFSESQLNTLSLNWEYRENGTSTWITGGTLTPVINSNNNTYSNGNSPISLGNNFDYQKSYEFHIVAQDRIYTSETTPKVTEGIPMFDWGKGFFNVPENFKINNIIMNNRIVPVELYNSSSGTNGTVILSETSANFIYLEIFYARKKSDNSYVYSSKRVYSPNGKQVTLDLVRYSNDTTIQMESRVVDISGTSITTVGENRINYINGTGLSNYDTNSNIYITRVDGYK